MNASDRSAAVPAWVAVVAVGLLTGLQPITTDLYLPALPQMKQDLHLSASQAQWTLSVLILAFGLGQLIWGPVASSIVWGLGFSTLLTLFVMPLLYRAFMRRGPEHLHKPGEHGHAE